MRAAGSALVRRMPEDAKSEKAALISNAFFSFRVAAFSERATIIEKIPQSRHEK